MIEWLRNLAADEFGRNLITIGGTLIAVAFGTFLGAFKDVFIEGGKRKRLAWLTAVRLTVILDKYVDECSACVQDEGSYDPEGYRHTNGAEPTLEYPGDLGWTSLKRELMYAAFRLKVEHDSVVKGLEFVGSEIAFPPDYEEYYSEKRVLFSNQGLATLELVRSWKDHYGVPTADRRDYDPRTTFDRMLAQRAKYDAEREARRQELEKKRIEAGEPPGLFPI
ncbi:hypothetical protein [Neorhizobium galegae]|uniref:hypothetical protein n=1 Tax=Neorhizobium galegae TaxID=399 RepID=UPI00210702A1|nr:hypothetical protein [Neorhizobium galegae]MCQ1855832.1 hypothetical protein [Neorhizobium galegae]